MSTNKRSIIMPTATKFKIGFVLDDSLDSNDGVAQYVKTLGAWLSKRGHHVNYLVGETKTEHWQGGKVFSLAKNVRVKFNGNWVSVPLPARASHINSVLRQQQFDVLHVQVPYSPFLAGRIINQAYPKAAIVGTFHIFPFGLVARLGGKLLGLWTHFSIKKFNFIVSVSSPAADFASKSFGIETKIVPNVVDVGFYQRVARSKASGQDIVFLGRLVERKGCDHLIEAFSRLHKKFPSARLHVAGSGPERSALENKVHRLKLSDQVKFYGFVSEEQKAKLLAMADIACFPSTGGESFGIVLVEAMAAGAKVVLGGNNPGYRSVLGEQPKLLINPLDPTNFASCLEEFMTNKKLCSEVYEWQQAQLNKYDVACIGPMIEALYAQAIASKTDTKA